MGARLYNPATGLFTSQDPVQGGNTTTYTYPQDPINKQDTTGHWGWVKKAWGGITGSAKWLGKKAGGAARATGRFIRRNGRAIGHLVIGGLITAGSLALAGVACGATAGVGCVVAGSIAIGMMPKMAGHLLWDKATGRKTTGRGAIGHAFSSILPPFSKVFKPMGKVFRRFWRKR